MAPPSHAPPVGYWAAGSTLSPDPDDAAPVDLTSADSLDLDARAPTLPQVNGGTGCRRLRSAVRVRPGVRRAAGRRHVLDQARSDRDHHDGSAERRLRQRLPGGRWLSDRRGSTPSISRSPRRRRPSCRGFALVQGGEIRGRVLGDCDCPLPGIRVSTGPGFGAGDPLVGWHGRHQGRHASVFAGLPPGEYTIVVDLPDGVVDLRLLRCRRLGCDLGRSGRRDGGRRARSDRALVRADRSVADPRLAGQGRRAQPVRPERVAGLPGVRGRGRAPERRGHHREPDGDGSDQ